MVEKRLLEWEFSRYLLLTSFLFLIPSMYSLYHGWYIYSSVIMLSAMTSMNYWRNATYSWRRDMDLFFQKLILCFFIYLLFQNRLYIPMTIIGTIYCYLLSWQLWEDGNKDWWKYHILFHLFVVSEMMTFLYLIAISLPNVHT